MRAEVEAGDTMASAAARLTSGRLLAGNVVWNLIGQGAPLLVAVVAIPLLVQGLGIDRFGVLTLAWTVIGYFSLFDLGLSRALTKLVAEKLGAEQTEAVPALVWTALAMILALGILGGAVLGLLAPWLAREALKLPAGLQMETIQALYLLALSVPVVITTAGLRGVLEAQQRFALASAVRLPLGLFTYVGPLLVLPFSQSLTLVVAVLMVGRILGWLVHMAMCLQVMPALGQGIRLQRAVVGPLLRFGGWLTVTNVIGPLMVYLDRFLIGAVLSVAAVAYYVAPSELVSRLLLIPAALVSVLFPAFATSLAHDRARATRLFGLGLHATLLVLFPVALACVVLAEDGLNLWLGSDFAANSTRVLQWLAIGVFLNSLAQVPFALLQAAGRPNVTAALHLVELPLYLVGVLWLLHLYGVEGAAIAWTARVAVDTVCVFGLALWCLPASARVVRRPAVVATAALAALAVAAVQPGLSARMAIAVLALGAFAPAVWYWLLGADERALVRNHLKLLPGAR